MGSEMCIRDSNWPFFVGPVNGIVVSLILYVILSKLFPAKNA